MTREADSDLNLANLSEEPQDADEGLRITSATICSIAMRMAGLLSRTSPEGLFRAP